jgi:hypothetical protein
MQRSGAAAVLALALLATASAASAASTCYEDENGNKTCCDQWKSQTFHNGQPYGLVIDDTIDQLQREIANDKKADRAMCRYFGAQDSSCSTTYGPPQCVDLPSSVARNAVIANGDRLVVAWTGALQDALRRYRSATQSPDGRNPYAGIGNTLMDYGKVLNDALGQQRALRELLQKSTNGANATLLHNMENLTQQFTQTTQRLQGYFPRLPPALRPQGVPGGTQTQQATTPPPPPPVASPPPYSPIPAQNAAPHNSCPDLTACLDVRQATWDDRAHSMTVQLANHCSQTLRIGMWLPNGAGYSPSFGYVPAGGTASISGTGTSNSWNIQASHQNATNQCLKYP